MPFVGVGDHDAVMGGSALPFWQSKWQKKATGSDANGFLRGLVS
jgi:hypothetical protein